MEPQYSVTFSTAVESDLQALIDHLQGPDGTHKPARDTDLSGIIDFVLMHQGSGGVISLPVDTTGMTTAITPESNALNQLFDILELGAVYATGIAEFAFPHGLKYPVDIDFGQRLIPETQLIRIGETDESVKKLVEMVKAVVNANLIVVLPNAFRPGTLTVVTVLYPGMLWKSEHEEKLHANLQSTLGGDWTVDRESLA